MLTNGNKKYSNEHPKGKKPTEEKNIKVASYRPGKQLDVAKLKRRTLVNQFHHKLYFS